MLVSLDENTRVSSLTSGFSFLRISSAWSPAVLARNSVAAYWDVYKTNWQDNAGTTPAIDLTDQLAIMQDAAGGKLGPELVTSFQASDWLVGGANVIADVAGGITVAYVDTTAGATISNLGAIMLGGTATGVFYELTVMASVNAGSCTIRLAGSGIGTFDATVNSTTPVKVTQRFFGSLNSVYYQTRGMGPGQVITLTGMEIKQVLGYHATQPVTAQQPMIDETTVGSWVETSTRRNLLDSSHDILAADWGGLGATIGSDFLVVPDVGNVALNMANPNQYWPIAAYTTVTASLLCRREALQFAAIGFSNGSGYTATATFDLDAVTVATLGSHPSASLDRSGTITEMSPGLFLCTFTLTPTGTIIAHALFNGSTVQGNGPYARNITGDGTSGIYVLGTQVEYGATATPMQKVENGIVYEWVEKTYRHTLFDGIDDNMSATLPDMGTAATKWDATVASVTIEDGLTIGAGSYNLPTNDWGAAGVLDRAMTTPEVNKFLKWAQKNHTAAKYATMKSRMDVICMNAVDVKVYDTTRDSDGGAWVDTMGGLGAELVSEGSYQDSSTGGTAVEEAGGVVYVVGTANNSRGGMTQQLAHAAGAFLVVTINVLELANNSLSVTVDNNSSIGSPVDGWTVNELGEHTFVVQPILANTWVHGYTQGNASGRFTLSAKVANESWFHEPLNTVTRGATQGFPKLAVIVAETNRVVIYDGTDPALPMWMVFLDTGALTWSAGGTYAQTGVAAIDGAMIVCSVQGFVEFSFAADDMRLGYSGAGSYGLTSSRSINGRNDPTAFATGQDGYNLVSFVVNDVAITTLPGAPTDPATGLPVPTIAVATDGGVSVIKDDGNVWDSLSTVAVSKAVLDGSSLWLNLNSGAEWLNLVDDVSLITADGFVLDRIYRRSDTSSFYPKLGFSGAVNKLAIVGDDLAVGTYSTEPGLYLLSKSGSVVSAGKQTDMVAAVTDTYNTGWMVGDTKGAWLSDTDTATLIEDTRESYAANGFTPDIVLDWKRGKFLGASLTGESNFTAHARASGGTVVDSDGLVKWGAHNLFRWSGDLDASGWLSLVTDTTFTPGITDPDGASTATTLTATSGSARVIQSVVFSSTSAAHTDVNFKIWIRRRTGVGAIHFEASGVGLGPEIAGITSTWSLFAYSGSGSVSTTFQAGIRILTAGDEIDVAFARVHAVTLGGMQNNPATGDSYVPTTDAAVYLGRDNYTWDGTSWVGPKRLVEPQARTNLADYSNEPAAQLGGWNTSNLADLTLTSDVTTGIDGDISMDKLEKTGTGLDAYVRFILAGTALTNYTASFYVEKDNDESRFPEFALYDSTDAVGSFWQLNTKTGAYIVRGTAGTPVNNTITVEEYSATMWKVILTLQTGATGSNELWAIMRPSAGTVWGAFDAAATGAIFAGFLNLEVGLTPTSYIPTGASPVTRALETLEITAAALSREILAATGSSVMPAAVSIKLSGTMSYADEDLANQVTFSTWSKSAIDYLSLYMQTTGSRIGQPRFLQREAVSGQNIVLGSNNVYTPGLNVPFSIASRHGATFINGAHEGTVLVPQSPTALADLIGQAIKLASVGDVFNLEECLITFGDIGDTGLGETSNLTAPFSQTVVPDRSANANPLTVTGTVSSTPVADGADLVAYSGFSPTNYVGQAYNADLDFGTGDFSICGWVKGTDTNAHLFDRVQDPVGGAQMRTYASSTTWTVNMGAVITVNESVMDDVWHFLCVTRVSGVMHAYLDGVLKGQVTNTANLSNVGAVTRLGTNIGGSSALVFGQMALWRISATAPSAAQIAKSYANELSLFQPKAAATLAGAGPVVTGLSNDPDLNLLHVMQSDKTSIFDGLERVSEAAGGSTTIDVVSGLVAKK